jgi:hypothetical protein
VDRLTNNVYFQLILGDDLFELMINLVHLFLALHLIFNLLNFFPLISYHQYKLHKYLCRQLYLCVNIYSKITFSLREIMIPEKLWRNEEKF